MNYKPQTTNNFRITNYQLPITNYELPITNYELGWVEECRGSSPRGMRPHAEHGDEITTNYELRITNYELRITNYEL